MDTLKPMGLWIVTLAMRSDLTGEYLATRSVGGVDPDDVTARAMVIEQARQAGVVACFGAVAHDVLGVVKVRRVLDRRVR